MMSNPARLAARPQLRPTSAAAPTASSNHLVRVEPLGVGSTRDGWLYVPHTYDPGQPSPLVVMCHGAGGKGEKDLATFGPLKNLAEHRCILVAPDSRGITWDMIRGGFGPDVRFIDQALHQVFSRYAVDPARTAVAGFSDGASYALSLGVANGDLFSHIIGFSPGFMRPPAMLQRLGLGPKYVEFDGPHSVPLGVALAALHWMLDNPREGA